jgi:uncharacterized iron-regulated protein
MSCAEPAATPSSSSDAFTKDGAWTSPLDREHPLVGRIWDVAASRYVEPQILAGAVRGSRFVAIGEQHDNVDHHRLEAILLGAVTATRRPAVVFEMLDVGAQEAVNRAEAAHPGDPDAIAAAVDWEHSGWPAWSMYRPVFAVAAAHDLAVVGGGFDRAEAHRIARSGVAALAPELVGRFALTSPLDPTTASALRDEMREAHCGMLPESMLDVMSLVQRSRDAELAGRLADRDDHQGAVLIAGNGHVRTDRGVPRVLAGATHARVLSVALVEVHHEWTLPGNYAAAFGAAALPFDYVWFTPRASDEDHCAELGPKK